MAKEIPVIRQIRWAAVVPQVVVLAILCGLGHWISSPGASGVIWGCAVFLAYSYGSRLVLARDHRRGVRFAASGRFEDAIPYYEASYRFFSEHPWIDTYRSLTLMSASTWSYREMALANIAFALSQAGRGADAKAAYERTLAEFPDSPLAKSALRLIEAVEDQVGDGAA